MPESDFVASMNEIGPRYNFSIASSGWFRIFVRLCCFGYLRMGIPFSPEKSRMDKTGRRWNFCYWYSGPFADQSCKAQRLFFWNDAKETCGVILFLPGKTIRYSQISDFIDKLVAHESVRKRYQRELLFPLEEHYMLFGSFPEEISN